MKRMDCNCFCGTWPFHKVRNHTLESLHRLHMENGIDRAYVSNTEAIFYNDPYEAECDFAKKLCQFPNYMHVMVINPTLPGWKENLRDAIDRFSISGIRILPGLHGYSLCSKEVDALCAELRKYRLPLFLTLRMEDERVTYLFHPKAVPCEELSAFLTKHGDLKILLCNIRIGELLRMAEPFFANQSIFADCSGLKDALFPMEEMQKHHFEARLVYGSLAPLFCLKSSLLLVENSTLCEDAKQRILSGCDFLSAK